MSNPRVASSVNDLPESLVSVIRDKARAAKAAGRSVAEARVQLRQLLAIHGIDIGTERFRLARQCFLEAFAGDGETA